MDNEENELEIVLDNSTDAIQIIYHSMSICENDEVLEEVRIRETAYGNLDVEWDYEDYVPSPEILAKMGGLRESEFLDRCIEVILHNGR